MELLKIKCRHCDQVSVLRTNIITPFYGKLIKLKCGNPVCNLQLKIRVPELSKQLNLTN